MDPRFTHLVSLLSPLYGAGEARAIAFLALEDGFGVSRTDVYADKVRQFSETEHSFYTTMCSKLAEGVPVQQVLERAEFLGRTFRVTPDVLIPRPETEQLVELALSHADRLRRQLPAFCPLRILDAGTGSGCIAVSLKLALPEAEVIALDLSADALSVARGNAERLGAEVQFVQADMLAADAFAALGPLHIIVSNPPYIRQSERAEMDAHVTDHEPAIALFVPDSDPQRFYRALSLRAQESLLPGGALLVEGNSALMNDTAAVMTAHGLHDVRVREDCFGLPRMAEGVR